MPTYPTAAPLLPLHRLTDTCVQRKQATHTIAVTSAITLTLPEQSSLYPAAGVITCCRATIVLFLFLCCAPMQIRVNRLPLL